MPARARDPGKPTVYLDTSAITDAFAGAGNFRTPSPFAPLFGWIERVAREANLCLSMTHIGELSRWPDHRSATGVAAWLDELPTVWVYPSMKLEQHLEPDHWLKVAVGIASREPFSPFAPSFASSIVFMNPAFSAEFLKSAKLAQQVDVVRQIGWETFVQGGFDMTNAIRRNRQAAAAAGVNQTQLATLIRRQEEDEIRAYARAAHGRLIEECDTDYVATGVDEATAQDSLVHLFRADPTALPSHRMAMAFNTAFIASAQARKPGSNKEVDQLTGALSDRMHAVGGGVYCDVFTCDRPSSAWVSPVRRALGRLAPIVLGRHPRGDAGFVEDLMATCP